MKFPLPAACAALLACQAALAQQTQSPTTGTAGKASSDAWFPPESEFQKVVLDQDEVVNGEAKDTIVDPMELAVAKDGRVLWAERAGVVKLWKPATKKTVVIATIPVFTGLEEGMLGITLDPKFTENGWVYLNRSLTDTYSDGKGKAGKIRVARFTLKGDQLDLASEKTIIEMEVQREQCCHVGGSLAFDKNGNLFVSIGDNTNPFDSDGFSPSDERSGRYPWDAQRSAANPNSLVGKILRIKPKADGGYTIPKGNLFPVGTANTRPEVYVMGNRNPFRISVDRANGFLYWGEVGPDAGGPNEKRGPAGFDEINQARSAGNFGWPFVIGDNRPYRRHDFAANTNGEPWDPARPVNESRYNTGPRQLPPAQPAFIWYPYGASTRFPAVKSGGRTACAGPVYRFDPRLASPHKLPREFDHTLFVYEWSRNWILAVHLDADDQIAKAADGSLRMEPFCPGMTFRRPMDVELGPDGCLYVLENGSAWIGNRDTQLVRIEHHPTGK